MLNHVCRGTPIKERKTICYTAISGTKMTEKTNKNEAPLPEKLLVDDPMNFPFHAAYVVYSDCFDAANDIEVKAELNRNIEALKQNEIDCETFYRKIAHYRKMGPALQERFSLQTQRKRDWRKKSQRADRIKRHKK